jgi:hypothetical protein
MNSNEFTPTDTLDVKQVKGLFNERFPGKVAHVSSESAGNTATS